MKTLVLKIAYDGTDFVGMQWQPNGRTVEQELRTAIERLYGEQATIVPAGRTDAGVHARGMVIHTCLVRVSRIPLERIQRAFNGVLPADVRVCGVLIRNDTTFHARYNARRRTYTYTIAQCDDPLLRRYAWIYHAPFREELLQQCADVFVGTHDFTTFSKFNSEQRSYICTVERCQWQYCGSGQFRLIITANRFVYGMVRALVGAMLDCARGKRSSEEIAAALLQHDRRLGSPLAPPHGLVFESVEYPEELGVVFHSYCEES
ncbi:MAG: tRNA pseudouridine(38-40) synthase TruA [Chlorobi bacterium]|nr:tRNA pseudouridine(38-40) synthase TruA [Chlorobiota bacterium]